MTTSRSLRALLCGSGATILLLGSVSEGWCPPACSVTSSGLAFGEVSSAILNNTTPTITGTISFTCSGFGKGNTLRVCIALDHYTGGQNYRTMTSGSDALNYNLYSDAAYTQIWGTAADGGIVTIDAPMSGGNASGSATVYGKIFAGQTTAPTGSYTQFLSGDSNDLLTAASGAAAGSPCTSITSNPATFDTTNTATISSNCDVSATDMLFGSVGSLSSPVSATNTITVKCISGAPYSIALGAGLSNATNPTIRKMTFGSNAVTYGIYQSPGTTQPWGWTQDTDTVSGTGTGQTQSYSGYGIVPSQNLPMPGTYSDTIVVTITY